MARLSSLVLILALLQSRYFTYGYHATNGLIIQSDPNKALYGHSFFNISRITEKKCLERCLANCLCLSFQVYGNDSSMSCQLCSSNKDLKPHAMSESKGCTSYNFVNLDEVDNQQCGRSCTSVINCCMTHNPCLNGGTCLPPMPSSRKRFRCKCREGYEGERCGQPIEPLSAD